MALRSRESILRAHRERVSRNAATAGRFFDRHGDRFGWVPPRGGTVCFPRLLSGAGGTATAADDGSSTTGRETESPGRPHGEGAEAFCARVLRDTGVLLLPSTVYDYGDQHFRLGLGREDFAPNLAVLDTYLSEPLT
jgi:aspartate/methionine/tyrosine aminotransferase